MEKNNSELEFKAGNPGAVQYGNFINYYQFHPPQNRLKILPTDIWEQTEHFIGLDLGCNAGDLTIALFEFLNDGLSDNNISILGVDIDPTLIERATEKNIYTNNIEFKTLDFMELNTKNYLIDYLKQRSLDNFSTIFCFSITMWIHLNHDDDGLKRFLKQICDLGKNIVIEPQPWKCYKSAVKRMKTCNYEFPCFAKLKIRQNVEEFIEQFLTQQCKMLKIFESNRTEWERKVLIFKKPNII